MSRVLHTVFVLLFVLLPVAACSDDTRLVVHTAKGDYLFTVEIADTDEARTKGLMYRQELASDAGMLFDFQEERDVSFWMRNTYIPLDMVFITADGTVKRVHVNAKPHDTTGIPSGAPVRFVLEIPGGRSVEIGLVAGDKVDHPRIGN